MPGHNARVTHPVYTVGHSNRDLEAFLELLATHGIEMLVDVRAFPGSRKWPHFGLEQLSAALADRRVDYLHVPQLGGRRSLDPERPDSHGGGWRNASFRAYAQYAQTEPYAAGIDRVVELALDRRLALMCSEAVPWRCHRWLVSDSLTARGVEVLHILDGKPARRHVLSPFACASDGMVTWPGPPSDSSLGLGPPVPR